VGIEKVFSFGANDLIHTNARAARAGLVALCFADLREQFKHDALPIADDLLNFSPDDAAIAAHEDSVFVRQLELAKAAGIPTVECTLTRHDVYVADECFLTGSAAEIKQFCETNYQVDFPLTEKNRVVGAGAHPFYRWAAAQLGDAGTPRWNFHKYLVGPDGQLAGTWPTPVRPGDPKITAEIENALPKP
jgi:hypothetical protein